VCGMTIDTIERIADDVGASRNKLRLVALFIATGTAADEWKS
jgi:hypothetical protein